MNVQRGFSKFLDFFNRSRWAASLLNLPRHNVPDDNGTGLLCVQIDGFAHSILGQALEKGRMPFLSHLIDEKGYKIRRMYSGLPPTTPSVQAELFYGHKTAVPAFQFVEHKSRKAKKMFDPVLAASREDDVSKGKKGLLEGGSAYSNIYTGGAAEPHFCVASMGWGRFFDNAGPFAIALVFLTHIGSLFKMCGLVLLELYLALVDVIKGVMTGHDFFSELWFIISRLSISVLLREAVTICARVDLMRCLPVVHLNYLGYDEQAHRRGPDTEFSHWTLRGIDSCIKRLFKGMHDAKRNYNVLIYSDHGQEQTQQFTALFGEPVQLTVRTLAAQAGHKGNVITTAQGPTGHVYLKNNSHENIAKLAKLMGASSGFPLVCYLDKDGKARGFLNGQAKTGTEQMVGDHPHAKELTTDLGRLLTHDDSGDIVFIGTFGDTHHITYAAENGSHGGLGCKETTAFVLYNPDSINELDACKTLRPLDLYEKLGKIRPKA